jgi:hypothetical protein
MSEQVQTELVPREQVRYFAIRAFLIGAAAGGMAVFLIVESADKKRK